MEALAKEKGVRFSGIKRSSKEDQFFQGTTIADTLDNYAGATQDGYQFVAGTAWLFARPELDQALDYLFIDEAGQVSLANVIAMGVCAKNIVLGWRSDAAFATDSGRSSGRLWGFRT